MPFQLGEVNTPGRPKKKLTYSEALREVGELVPEGETKPNRVLAAEAMWLLARRGSLEAYRFIVERLEGKTPDVLHQDVVQQIQSHNRLDFSSLDSDKLRALADVLKAVRDAGSS